MASQDWSNGKVGLSGVSYLVISKYYVATCKHHGGPPKALCAISPWEGVGNFYEEFFNQGGVNEVGFPDFWWVTLDRAPVRLEVRGSRETVHAVRDEQTWPLPTTRYRKLFLDPARRELVADQAPALASNLAWEARGTSGADLPNDMVIFAALRKLDNQGRVVRSR